MKKVFPDRWLEDLPRTHPVFTAFYDIREVFPQPPYGRYLTPRYLGYRTIRAAHDDRQLQQRPE